MKRLTLVLALIGAVDAAQAQQVYPTDPPKGPVHIDRSGAAKDATGARIDANDNRVIGSEKWRPNPGDPPSRRSETMPDRPKPPQPSISAQPPQLGEAVPANRRESFKDEYGFRYDGRGNRIDGRGSIISPQSKSP